MIVDDQTQSGRQAASAYSLRKGMDAWELVFEGHRAVLKHEQGVRYVAYLLKHPYPDMIHPIDLLLRVQPAQARADGMTELVDAATGRHVPLTRDARLYERSLGLDAVESARALRRRERLLEAILEDDDQDEPVKAEAMRELEEIERVRPAVGGRVEDQAKRVTKAVRRAIHRLQARLAQETDEVGRPHDLLRRFARHIERHILLPSTRYGSRKASLSGAGLSGCLVYEPPAGVIWENCGAG